MNYKNRVHKVFTAYNATIQQQIENCGADFFY